MRVRRRRYFIIIGMVFLIVAISLIFLTFIYSKLQQNMSNPNAEIKLNKNKISIRPQHTDLQQQQQEHQNSMSHTHVKPGKKTISYTYYVLHELIEKKNLINDYNNKLKLAESFDERQQILNTLSASDLYSLLKKEMTKLTKLKETQLNTIKSNYSYTVEEKTDFDLSELKVSDFGIMYLFDLFGDSCSHGDKVFDVVKQILNDYKLDSVINNLIIRPVNYFSNVELGDSLFYNYYKAYIDQDYLGGKKNLAIDASYLPIDSNETPTNYLEAIYTSAIDTKPDIISSSYKGTCGFSYIQKSLTDENDYTNYLTAALNDSMDIDKTKLAERIIGEPFSIIEPLASYYRDNSEKGTIIVGNQIDINRYEGMYSSSGTSITALGKGIRWGKVDCTVCIDSVKDVGTSFATPEVATKLLIAKAWWRTHNADCNAIEARRRLILATNLNDSFLGKFASSGNINLNKLLQADKAYLVKNDDTVIPIDSIYTALITNGSSLTRLKFSTNVEDISGLYVMNGKVVGLKNRKSPKWEIIPEPTSIDLTVKRKSDQVIIPIAKEEFLKEYKQFVILK